MRCSGSIECPTSSRTLTLHDAGQAKGSWRKREEFSACRYFGERRADSSRDVWRRALNDRRGHWAIRQAALYLRRDHRVSRPALCVDEFTHLSPKASEVVQEKKLAQRAYDKSQDPRDGLTILSVKQLARDLLRHGVSESGHQHFFVQRRSRFRPRGEKDRRVSAHQRHALV